MKSSPTVGWVLRCYPDWWQDRYGDEVRALSDDLVSEGRAPIVVALDLLRGAVAARTQGRGMPRTVDLWSSRTRVSIATATLPWMLLAPLVIYAVAGQQLRSSAGLVMWDGFDFFPTHLVVSRHAAFVPAPPLTPVGLVVTASAFAMLILFLIAFVVLFFGWSRLTGAIARHASLQRRRTRLLAWTPLFSLLLDVLLIIAIGIVHPSAYVSRGGRPFVPIGGHLAILHMLDKALPVVAVGGWLLAAVCVAVASRRADTDMSDLRYGKSIAVITTTLFTLMAVACVTWGVGLVLQARDAAHGNFTTIAYSHPSLWLPLSAALVTGSVLSILGATAALKSWRVTEAFS